MKKIKEYFKTSILLIGLLSNNSCANKNTNKSVKLYKALSWALLEINKVFYQQLYDESTSLKDTYSKKKLYSTQEKYSYLPHIKDEEFDAYALEYTYWCHEHFQKNPFIEICFPEENIHNNPIPLIDGREVCKYDIIFSDIDNTLGNYDLLHGTNLNKKQRKCFYNQEGILRKNSNQFVKFLYQRDNTLFLLYTLNPRGSHMDICPDICEINGIPKQHCFCFNSFYMSIKSDKDLEYIIKQFLPQCKSEKMNPIIVDDNKNRVVGKGNRTLEVEPFLNPKVYEKNFLGWVNEKCQIDSVNLEKIEKNQKKGMESFLRHRKNGKKYDYGATLNDFPNLLNIMNNKKFEDYIGEWNKFKKKNKKYQSYSFSKGLLKKDIEGIKVYLSTHNIDLNRPIAGISDPRMKGCYPLQLAIKQNKIKLVKLLIKFGANPDKKFSKYCFNDNFYIPDDIPNVAAAYYYVPTSERKGTSTLLHYAIFLGDNYKMFKTLVDAGANINIKNDDGNTPLQIFSTYNQQNMVKYCLNNGATSHYQ